MGEAGGLGAEGAAGVVGALAIVGGAGGVGWIEGLWRAIAGGEGVEGGSGPLVVVVVFGIRCGVESLEMRLSVLFVARLARASTEHRAPCMGSLHPCRDG